MFTLEKHDNKMYFELNGKMITKTSKGWLTLQGDKVDRNVIHNLLHSKTHLKQAHRQQLKSVLNRHFNGNYKFN